MSSEKAPSIRRNAASTLPPFSERLGEQMQNDFAVGGRLKNGAFALELVPQNVRVDQIAIVRNRHLSANAIDHERLRIFDRAGARRGITRVTDGALPFKLFQFDLAEHLGNQPHVLMNQERGAGAVARHDPGAFLSAMLKSEKSVIGQHRRVRVAENAEEPAFVLRIGLCVGQLGSVGVVRRGHTK